MNNGLVNVYPVPSSNNGIKVFHVNKSPVNGSGSALVYSHDDILYFPEDKIYLVVLYASCKSLLNALASISSSLPSDLVIPPTPTAPTMAEKVLA